MVEELKDKVPSLGKKTYPSVISEVLVNEKKIEFKNRYRFTIPSKYIFEGSNRRML